MAAVVGSALAVLLFFVWGSRDGLIDLLFVCARVCSSYTVEQSRADWRSWPSCWFRKQRNGQKQGLVFIFECVENERRFWLWVVKSPRLCNAAGQLMTRVFCSLVVFCHLQENRSSSTSESGNTSIIRLLPSSFSCSPTLLLCRLSHVFLWPLTLGLLPLLPTWIPWLWLHLNALSVVHFCSFRPTCEPLSLLS